MKRIALFGGAFDPPHVGHRNAIRGILDAAAADEVWLVPTGDRHDKSVKASAQHRLHMLEAFLHEDFYGDPRVRIERCQIDGQPAGSYTIDLMRHLEAAHPRHHYLFVIGSDLIPQLPSWKDSDELLKKTEFLVLPRPGFPADAPAYAGLRALSPQAVSLSAASSSEARRLLREQKETAGVLTPAVSSYIEKHQLYRAG